MLTIDGSMGEGGGQIVRTALALAITSGRAVRISKIRAGRKRSGLLRQHLTAVQAAAAISGAEVAGDRLGSSELTFAPGEVRPGDYFFDIGSAGSTTLVLQTILPPLLSAGGSSTITLQGGTHNPHAPPVDFLEHAFLPLIGRMGPRVSVDLQRPGFFPRGGGRIAVRIEPVRRLAALELLVRGPIRRRRCLAVVCGLPIHIARRELDVVARLLQWPGECCEARELTAGLGQGNYLSIEIGSDQVTEVFTGFGERGVRAERVAENASREAVRYLAADVPVGEHLADQLLLPLSLAGRGAFVTQPLSSHATTNIEVIRKFLDVDIHVHEQEGGRWRVEVG